MMRQGTYHLGGVTRRDEYSCLLGSGLLPRRMRSRYSVCLVMPDIDMVDMNSGSICVLPITNGDMHTLKRYEEVLGEKKIKQTRQNWCRVFYRRGKCMLSRFYCDECRESVCVLMDQGSIPIECASVHRWELPVLHYQKIMVIYPYPFLVVIAQLFSWMIL